MDDMDDSHYAPSSRRSESDAGSGGGAESHRQRSQHSSNGHPRTTDGRGGSERSRSRKRSYQDSGGTPAYGSRSSYSSSSSPRGPRSPPGNRPSHSQQQLSLNAIASATRAFIEDGPSAAMSELGSMGPVAIALIVIVVFQYRSSFVGTARRTKHMLEDFWYHGIRPGGLLGGLFRFLDYFRSAFYLVWDAAAGLRVLLPQYGGLDDDDSTDGAAYEPRRGRGGRRRRLMDRGSDAIPELKIMLPLGSAPGASAAAATGSGEVGNDEAIRKRRRRSCQFCGVVHIKAGRRLANGGYCHGIDPAFLDDVDYPPGWLVYDPILGVTRKYVFDQKRRDDVDHKNVAMATKTIDNATRISKENEMTQRIQEQDSNPTEEKKDTED